MLKICKKINIILFLYWKTLIYSVSATNFHQASRLHLFIDTTLVKYCYIQNSNESSIQDKTCQDKEFFFLFALAIFSFKVKMADSNGWRGRISYFGLLVLLMDKFIDKYYWISLGFLLDKYFWISLGFKCYCNWKRF